jgi:hypothetical protein
MEPLTAVAGGDDRSSTGVPALDDAVDRVRVQVRSVGEDDDRRLRLFRKFLEPAAQGGARAAFPFQTLDRPRLRLDLVGADDDDHVVYQARTHALEHGREQ